MLIILSLISFVSLVIFTYLIRISIKKFNYPLISIFFLVKFFIFAYIGPVIHLFYPEGYYYPHIMNQWILSTSVLLFLPLGMLSVSRMLKFDGVFTYKFQTKDFTLSNQMFYTFIFLFLASIVGLAMYIEKLEMIPLVGVIQGLSVSEVYELRSAAGNTFPGKYYRYAMFMRDLPLYLLIVVFLVRNTSLKWRYFLYILLSYNVFVSIMDVQKAPLLMLFIVLILISFFDAKKIDIKRTFVYLVLSFISVILMYAFFLGHGFNLLSILEAFLNRVFFAQIDAFIYWQEYLDVHGFQYGNTLPNPRHIFPFDRTCMPIEVFKFKAKGWEEGMPMGTFPTVFYAEWYANYSYIGAFISMFVLGAILQFVDIFMNKQLRIGNTVILLGLYIYLINYFSKFASSTYADIIFDTHLVFPVLVALILNVFYKRSLSVK